MIPAAMRYRLPSSKYDRRQRPKREKRVGPTPERLAKPDELVLDPLDLLCRRGVITIEEHAAVERFATLYKRFAGLRIFARGSLDDERGRSVKHVDEARELAEEAEYRTAVDAVMGRGRQVLDVLVNVAVYRRYPHRAQGRFVVAARELAKLRRSGRKAA